MTHHLERFVNTNQKAENTNRILFEIDVKDAYYIEEKRFHLFNKALEPVLLAKRKSEHSFQTNSGANAQKANGVSKSSIPIQMEIVHKFKKQRLIFMGHAPNDHN